MANTYSQIYIQIVFAVESRQNLTLNTTMNFKNTYLALFLRNDRN